MSAVLIRTALETALAAMSPALATVWENSEYRNAAGEISAPAEGTPYQQVWLMFAEPDNPEISNGYTERGILQIDLRYPLKKGPVPASARAELIRTSFKRGNAYAASGVTVQIERTAEISPGRVEEDRYVIPVRVRFFSNIPRS